MKSRFSLLTILAGALLSMACAVSASAQSSVTVEDIMGVDRFADFTQWDFYNVARMGMTTEMEPFQAMQMPGVGYEESADSYSELSKVWYYQSTIPLTVDTENEKTIYIHVGNTTSVLIIPESYSVETRWLIKVYQERFDGTRDSRVTDAVYSGGLLYASVLEDSLLEITIVQDVSPASYPKQVWLTVIPNEDVLPYINSAINDRPIEFTQ